MPIESTSSLKSIVPLLVAACLVCGGSVFAQPDESERMDGPIIVIDGLSGPEAVHYDARQDVFFVSNFNGDAAGDANGFVSKIGPDGTIEALEFMVGTPEHPLHGPRGMRIVGNVLWVADADGLHGFDRVTGRQLEFIDFSGHAPGFLNDVEADDAGNLYLTDTGNARLFRIADGEISVVASSELVSPPNGIVWYGQADGFVLGPWGGGLELRVWRPSDATLVEIGQMPAGGNIDGLEIYNGRLIVASQAHQAIWAWSPGGASRLFETQGRPADIGIDTRRGRLGVPYIALDRVEIWSLPESW